ncbi:hypothetical protein [Paenibacillus mendelii]|uniref:Glycosyl transferase family 28 C-terminal domain-containing protein n=1 Tax=Paenibacillus mendelii TaxID=206163 RepID=A0ABV6JJ64_9BACL|nr:hypothetical protein [Paenibacillus mendelii]MCQ6558888.1 hypothetical protein [Paenibacillus mendelii]
MITICYYISDYGLGHAARSIAIIRSLIRQSRCRLRLIVCSSRALAFIRASLKDCNEAEIEYHQVSSDLGYLLKEGSIELDLDLMSKRYEAYIASFPGEVEREKAFLLQNKASLVVSDISPIPLLAANQVNIRSVGLSNFTWFTAYKQMLEEGRLAPLYDAYSQMDHFIALPGAEKEPHWGRRDAIRTEFFCRVPDEWEITKLRARINPDRSKCIVFFALGMSVDVHDLSELAMWEDDRCRFIVSSNMAIERENVFRIPGDYTESQNYVAIADVVITKPGWGTVSEAVKLNKPLVLLDRNFFAEDRHTVEALKGRHPYRLIEWEQLKRAMVTEPFLTSIRTHHEAQAQVSVECKQEQDALQVISDYLAALVM